MDPETFILRKKFLEEFYNEDRVRFLNSCQIFIRHNVTLNSDNEVYFRTIALINTLGEYRILGFPLKIFHKFFKPFLYFLYSITYIENFVMNQCLYIRSVIIECICSGERVNLHAHFLSDFYLHNFERLNFLKILKLKSFLSEPDTPISFITLRLNTYYRGVNHLFLEVSPHITNRDPKIINATNIFKDENCVICLTNPPNVLFCNCGHVCFCSECEKLKESNMCPVCKTKNEIIRILE